MNLCCGTLDTGLTFQKRQRKSQGREEDAIVIYSRSAQCIDKEILIGKNSNINIDIDMRTFE